jgi:predicted RNA binding protein YcfA (HicA-like mRNA interferase family)
MRALKGRELIRAFERAGFVVARTNGSHTIMKKDGHQTSISVPVHAGKDIKPGTLKGLITASGLTREEFWRFADS